MNIVDILLAAVVVFSIASGFSKGFIFGWVSLINWIGSLFAGLALLEKTAGLLNRWFPALDTWATPVALLVNVLLAHLIFSAVMDAFLRQVNPDAHKHGINKWLGMVPGFVRGWITATIVAALLVALPMETLLTDAARNSPVALSLTRQAGWLEHTLAPEIKEVLGKAVVRLPGRRSTDETVDLRFTVADPKPRPDLEAKMLAMVNGERTAVGLPPLKADPEILLVARAHSRDMFAKGYFAHVNPAGLTPADRIRKGGVRFLTAGENLALGPSLRRCHTGLMQSPGHRANILNPAFGRVGIAILDGGFYGLMITQNFRN